MDRLRERPAWSMTGSEKLTALDQLQADLTRLSTRRLELLASIDTDGYATELGVGNTIDLIAIRHRLEAAAVRRDLKLAHALPKYTAVSTALHTDPTTTGYGDNDHPASDTGAESPATTQPAADTDDTTGAETGADGATDVETDGATDVETDGATDVDGSGAEQEEAVGEAGPLVLHPGQAAVIVDALEKIPSSVRVSAEMLRFAEERMVKAAQVLPPGELRKLGREVRNRLDTDGPEPAEKRAAANERLWLKRTDDGIRFGGFLAGDNAELLQTMVFAGAKPHKTPDGQRDPRSREKRQADGLSGFLHTAAAIGVAPAHGGIKPHVTVTINLADLIAGTGTGDLAHGGALSAAAIRRLACDAGIIPLVLGANSEPLDVGTEERFVNRAMRRALNARDKGCVVCGAPPAMCEAHHIVHRANGGPTTVENLVLVCKAHHIDVHHGRWTITMHNGQPKLSRPDWATPTPTRTPTPARAPSRTPTAPPDPWTASPSDAPPAGSPAPGSSGGSPDPAPVTPAGAWPTTVEPAPETPRGAGPTTLEPAPDPGPAAPDPGPATPDPGPSRTAARGAGAAAGSAESSGRAAGPSGSTGVSPSDGLADYPDPWADEPPTRTTQPDTHATRPHPPGTGLTSPAPWPDDATAPATASGTGHFIARPTGRSANPLGDSPHPLGDTARPLDNPILEQLRREFADHPDPGPTHRRHHKHRPIGSQTRQASTPDEPPHPADDDTAPITAPRPPRPPPLHRHRPACRTALWR